MFLKYFLHPKAHSGPLDECGRDPEHGTRAGTAGARRRTLRRAQPGAQGARAHPGREFLNICLTKDSSLLLHAIHSLSTGGFLKKPDSALVLKLHTKKSTKQENAGLFVNSIL